jgi:hypothetical protein
VTSALKSAGSRVTGSSPTGNWLTGLVLVAAALMDGLAVEVAAGAGRCQPRILPPQG